MALPPRLLLPDAPALIAGHGRATLLTPDGELLDLPSAELRRALDGAPPLLVHGPATARRLDLPRFDACFDLLELFAFCLPARPAAPTPRGLAMALDLDPPADAAAAAALLPEMATILLRRLAAGRGQPMNRDAGILAAHLKKVAAWPWANSVLAALGAGAEKPTLDPYKVWRRLPDWENPGPASHRPASTSPPPRPAPGSARSSARAPSSGRNRPTMPPPPPAPSPRAQTRARRMWCSPRPAPAPARRWATSPRPASGRSATAPRCGSPPSPATCSGKSTRMGRLYPDPEERRRRVVVRKGRENYLCLLNLEEMLGQAGHPEMAVPLGLVARWALATRDGDLMGGDFPGWIVELHGPAAIWPLADRAANASAPPARATSMLCRAFDPPRPDCVLVVANHALVMVQAALGGGEDGRPLRYVFDEGHHLFDAADAAFSAAISGAETAELRRWLLGAEGGRSRARGLRRRIEELAGDMPNCSRRWRPPCRPPARCPAWGG